MDDFTKEMNNEFIFSELNDFRFLFNPSSDLSYGDDGQEEGFPCPFCSLQCDLYSLPAHMELEHRLESKPTICPICKEEIAIEIFKHFSLHHRNVFKSRLRHSQSFKPSRTFSGSRRASVNMSNESVFTRYSGDPFSSRSVDLSAMPTKSHRTLRSSFGLGSCSGSGSGISAVSNMNSETALKSNVYSEPDLGFPLDKECLEPRNGHESALSGSSIMFGSVVPPPSQDAASTSVIAMEPRSEDSKAMVEENNWISKSTFTHQIILSTIFDEL